MNEDFNIDQALANELSPQPNGGGQEPAKTDDKGQAPANQPAGDQPQETATFKWTDGRMVTPTEAERLLHEEFLPDYTKKADELAKLKKDPTDKQSGKEVEADGKDDSPIDQALAQEVDRVAKHLGYVKKDEVTQQIDSVIPRTAGAVRAESLLNETFQKLETEYDGSTDSNTGVAKPKFDRKEIMEYVQGEMKQGNRVTLSPLQIAQVLHPDEYSVYRASQLGKGNGSVKAKADLPQTEKNGTSGGGNPNPPAPKYDYSDGAKSIEQGLAAILTPQN